MICVRCRIAIEGRDRVILPLPAITPLRSWLRSERGVGELVIRMDRVNCKSAISSVAHCAAFAERSGVGQEVRGGWNVHMAPRARRRNGLHRIDEPLWIGYRIQSRQREVVLLRAIDVTESA